MNVKSQLAVVAVASTVVGVIGGTFLHAQTAAPPAYVIAEVQVTDADTFKQYLAALPGTLAPYQVRTLARANPAALETSTPPAGSLVVLPVNNIDDVKPWS